jgi:hypothetical protein
MEVDVSQSDWGELMAAREEFERPAVALPVFRSRSGAVREPSAKTVGFAEALAVSASWNRISQARRRLAA